MYKWIVCGILLFVNPIIATIIFVGWFIRDFHLAILKAKDERSYELSQFIVEDNPPWYWYVDFHTMKMDKGCNDYPSHEVTSNIRRDGMGDWYAQLTEESKTDALAYHERIKDTPLYDAESHDNPVLGMWIKINLDYSGKIEAAYQKYLHTIT